MKEMEMKVSMLKCPICDSNHDYLVKVEYEEGANKLDPESLPYYNTFITRKKIGGNVVELPVYEIDAFCLKSCIPFRILVDPPLPPGSSPIKFDVSAGT
ncbi:MAG: hypothetical protein ACP5UO_06290 [Thermoplasmata archaeon]